jgi:hypothetical protein
MFFDNLFNPLGRGDTDHDLFEDYEAHSGPHKSATHYSAIEQVKKKRVEPSTTVLEVHGWVSLKSSPQMRRAIVISYITSRSADQPPSSHQWWYYTPKVAGSLDLGAKSGAYFSTGHLSDIVFRAGKKDLFVLFDPEVGNDFFSHVSSIPEGGIKTFDGKDRFGNPLLIRLSRATTSIDTF